MEDRVERILEPEDGGEHCEPESSGSSMATALTETVVTCIRHV